MMDNLFGPGYSGNYLSIASKFAFVNFLCALDAVLKEIRGENKQ